MTEHEWLDLATAYALASLDETQLPTFRLHLSSCALCRSHVQEIRALGVPLAEPFASPPHPAVWARVRAEALSARPSIEVAELADVIGFGDAHAVCAALNRRVEHRFTGLYRVDPPLLRNLRLFDREHPHLVEAGPTPLAETYCSLVIAQREPFATADALADDRVSGHPAGANVRAYCGVPLRRPDGTPFGTLCHFDSVARPVPTSEIPLMQRVATLVMQRLDTD